jgi:lysine biosynthesis protein LysW
MAKAYCPNCDSVINVDSPRMGAMITCGDCGQELEVISVSPFEVDFPLDDSWDYEDEEED